MRIWMACLVFVFTLSAAGLAAWSLLSGQESPPPLPPGATAAPIGTSAKPAKVLGPLQRQMQVAAQRGADWLFRNNRPDGRFIYGYLPALARQQDGDHYLRQVGAAFALARAAHLTGDARHAAVARQAVLTLLLETTDGGGKSFLRYTTMPSVVVNRLASAGLLVLAINELPEPGEDLLVQSEQLCNYIRGQQQPDGSLSWSDNPGDPKSTAEDPDGINYYPGEALYGLMRSQQYRPAPWKTDVVRKAAAYYRPWWEKNRNMAFVPWQTAANAEAHLQSQGKEAGFAEFVYEMADWLCGLQYTMLDPKHPLWVGGFMEFMDGKVMQVEPQVGSAAYAEALAEACRVARQAGDVQRYQRYREALERCLQFTTTLQYTDANAGHFADWYRPRVLGGFHASHDDGNLRIDYAQHAVSALVQYLMYVAE